MQLLACHLSRRYIVHAGRALSWICPPFVYRLRQGRVKGLRACLAYYRFRNVMGAGMERLLQPCSRPFVWFSNLALSFLLIFDLPYSNTIQDY